MAALSESVPVSVETSLFGVECGREKGTVVISCKKSFINTLKLSDQELVSSLPVRVSVDISSAAVWNQQRQEYLLVQNSRDVCMWKEGQTVLDRAKKRHIPTDVHKLFSLGLYEPIVLCENGAVAFLGSGVKEACEKGILSDGQCITSCWALELHTGVCVIYTSFTPESKDERTVHSCWSSGHDDVWRHTAAPLESHGALLSCTCCPGPSGEEICLFTLWADGTLREVSLSERATAEQGQPIVVRGISRSCSLLCLTDNYIAIVGLQNKKQDGVGILDTKFGTVQAWQPLPEKMTTDMKAYCQRDHILVHCGKTLYLYQYECHTPTLSSMIGQQHGVPADKECSPVNVESSPQEKIQSAGSAAGGMEQNAELVRNLKNLADPVKTSSYTAFKREFAQMKNHLEDTEVWPYLRQLTLVLTRCCSENSFWPAVELEFLLAQNCMSANNAVMVFETLLKKKDVGLTYKALMSHEELPESCLAVALHCFLSATDEAVEKAAETCGQDPSDIETKEREKHEAEKTDGEIVPCPFSIARRFFVDKVFFSPFDDAFMTESLRKVPFSLVLDFLKYLLFVLHLPLSKRTGVKRNDLASKWSGVAMDAHQTQLILAKDAHKMLSEFSQYEDAYVAQLAEMKTNLEPLLEEMLTKSAKKQKAKGLYWCETLHLYF